MEEQGDESWSFCGSPFWNSSLSWNTSNPDLTLCFERTALIWTPCAFLWVFSPLEVYYLIHSKTRNVPWNFLNISKLAITVILSILCIADVGYAVYLNSQDGEEVFSVSYYTPFILFASFILSAVLLVYNRIRGQVTSGLLFYFWFLLFICGIFQYRSEIMKADGDDVDYKNSYFFISYMIYFPLVFIQFILHCFADKTPLYTEYPTVKNPCPEQTSSALSRLVFAWFDKLAWLGFRKPLETSDLWSMNPVDTAREVVPKFDKHWDKSVRKSAKEPGKASYRKKSGRVEIAGEKQKKVKGASILPAICKAFGPTFLFGAILKLINDCLTFVNPQILRLLIGFVEQKGFEPEWKGYIYALLMLITATVQTLVLSQYFHRMYLVGLRIRTALISAIYRKALRMSNSARKESTVGEIVNLMAVDAQRFMDLTTYLNMIWSAPLQIALALYFLWELLGPSVLAGLAVMIILIPLNGFIASKVKTLQIKQMKNKDERVKLMNEVLSGIKVLKLYAWEPSFEEQILKIRNKEIKVLKEAAYLNAGTSFIWSCAPFLVFLATISTFTFVNPQTPMTASIIFVTIAYFNILKFPFALFPFLLFLIVQVSLATLGCYVLVDSNNTVTATVAFVSLNYFNLMRFPMSMLPMLITFTIQMLLPMFGVFVYVYCSLVAPTVFIAIAILNELKNPLFFLPNLITIVIQVSLVTLGTYVFLEGELNATKAFVSLSYFNVLRQPLVILPMLISSFIQVSLVTFATYILSDENNKLTSNKAFVSLALFNILRFPLSMLPMMISSMVQASVSVKRINKFMNSDELDPNGVSHDETDTHPLSMENGTFSWGDEEKPTLRNINLQVKQGQLVAVVGSVGSGKSSLISAFLGEMEKITGRVNTKGSIAYVPQQAWIQNATLRDNILFGRTMDGKVYNSVVDACALKPDFDMLPGGDLTEIGEKGINLSGGQKQRVSLARAVYHNSDIYFLDDPLSAVDSHVGKHIFERVIGPTGILRNKTRILVTHGITYLPEVDWIVVVRDGEISETGNYKELLDKKGAFAEFLINHLQEAGEEAAEIDLEEIKTQLEGTVGAEAFREIQRQISESRSETGSLDRRTSTSSVPEAGTLKDRKASGTVNANGVVKPSKDKLIEVEKAETGSVKWNVYSHYLKSIGISLSVATIVMNMAFQGFSIGSNVWLSVWSDANATDADGNQDTAARDMYLGVYGALGIGQALSTLLGQFAMALGMVAASTYLHACMLTRTIHSPMSFFDTTPIGRIVNRFSKDIDTVDNILPITMRQWINTAFSALSFHQVLHESFCVKYEPTLQFLFIFFFHCAIYANAIHIILYHCYVVAITAFNEDLLPLLGGLVATIKIHAIMLHSIIRSRLSFFDTTPTGRILSRFSADVETCDSTIPRVVSDVVYCLFEVLATLVVISYTTPEFIAVIIPIGILYYFIQRFYVATSRQLKRIESVSRSPIYSHFGETVTGTQTIRAYNVQSRFIQESEEKVDFNQICYYPSIIANRWLAVRLEMVGNLIIFFAALFAVLSRDTMKSGLVGLSVTYALQITQTLNWLVRMTSDVETNIVAVERIKEYGETPQEAPWENPDHKPPGDWPKTGDVEFVDYKVRYRENLDLVLHGINFKVKGGEKVGIVGRTGAGKSSLTLALFRIIESAHGKILIDGVDISKLGLHDLRTRLTIIPQDPVLFSGTVRMNLDPFGRHTDEEIWRSLENAHLKAFVQQLTLKLDHEVSEGGENLSVGQRQLVCLARALLRKTKILILDEATAAVDLETDDLIQKTIRTEFKECTVLTIAHRLNTILDSDRVIVLDKGLIAEFDSPQKLLSQPKSVFYSMAKDAGITLDKNKK